MKKLVIVLFLTLSTLLGYSQTTFYDLGKVQKIEMFISQVNWDYQLDTLKAGSDGYLMIDSAFINGVPFYKPGVKYKGNSSYDPNIVKNPFHISLDKFVNNDYEGVTDIKLSNGYADPSLIREVLSYNILSNYMVCPRSNFAKVYINGNFIGLYSNDEDISKSYCAEKFYSKKSNTFIKANPIVVPSTNTKSNLKYINTDSTSYFNFYEMKSNKGWNDLVQLCDTVTNNTFNIGKHIDMDRIIWMLAFNSVLVNLDSYSGAFCQNYYLFKDNNGVFNPIVWDLNMSFGGFAFVGVSNSSLGSLSIANMKNLTPTIHANDVHWPLINVVMNNSSYRKKYFAHMRTILNENFTNGAYLSLANQLQSLISADVLADVNKFYSDAQFQNGLTEDVNIVNYSVPGIQNLMAARTTYLQSFSEVAATAPLLSSTTQTALVLPDSTVTISSAINNASIVYLNYRAHISKKFTKVQMHDDGTNGDPIANDGVYTASIKANPGSTQYYIYAENSDAGIFEPARAEHEFYTVQNNSGTGITKTKVGVKVYPNPSNTIINIIKENEGLQNYRVFNAVGQLMLEGTIQESLQLNVQLWESGVYIFQCNSEIVKLIVNK
jgi:spore coat protein CotH